MTEVYLFGSHIKGISSSGNPDIDLSFWNPKIGPLPGPKKIGSNMLCECHIRALNYIVNSVSFKIDIGFNKPTGNSYYVKIH